MSRRRRQNITIARGREMTPVERQLLRKRHALGALQKEKRASQAKIRHLNNRLRALDKKLRDYVRYAHELKDAYQRTKAELARHRGQKATSDDALLKKINTAEVQLTRCHNQLNQCHARFRACDEHVRRQQRRSYSYNTLHALTRWQRFLKQHAGKGKTMTQLAAAYHRKCD